MTIEAPTIHKKRPGDRINRRSKAFTQSFDRDRLNLVSRDATAHAAFAMLDKVQHESPELAYASIATLFALMSLRLRVDPQDGHALGLRLLMPDPYHQKANAQMDAMDDLAKQEWTGGFVNTYNLASQ